MGGRFPGIEDGREPYTGPFLFARNLFFGKKDIDKKTGSGAYFLTSLQDPK
jgi:hypothetical protein